LKPYVYFIHGLPGQTDETVDETVKAIEGSMKEGAERTILYRFQSLPMSAFSSYPSAPPTIRDSGSRKITRGGGEVNMTAKENLRGKVIRVVVAERYDRTGRNSLHIVKACPVVLIESPEHWRVRSLTLKSLA